MTNIKIKNSQQEIQRCKYCMEQCGNWCCKDCYELFESDQAYADQDDDE